MSAVVHREYKNIKKNFFPRWDRSGAWRLQVRSGLPCFGCCNLTEKTISVRPLPHGDGLRLLLIHEICHCCAGSGHGAKWQRRMRLASQTAARLGMGDLARMLTDEASAAGAQCQTLLAGAVYAMIRTCTAEFPVSAYEEIQRMVCRRLGLCMDEFETNYRRARRVFETAKN